MPSINAIYPYTKHVTLELGTIYNPEGLNLNKHASTCLKHAPDQINMDLTP